MPLEENAAKILRGLYDAGLARGEGAITGFGVSTTSGLAGPELNEAVAVLVSRGLARVVGGATTAPYSFASMLLTKAGQAEAERMNRDAMVDARRVFVIYGRDSKKSKAMFEFLSMLGLDPIEWPEALRLTGEASPDVEHAVRVALESSRAAIALFTGDDLARLRPELQNQGERAEPETPQPRQNVLLETGMALAFYPGRVVLVRTGRLREPPSDLAGRHWVKIQKGGDWRFDIMNRLKTAGCNVAEGKGLWRKAGADLEEAGAEDEASAQATAIQRAPAAPQRSEAELRLLFRIDVSKRVNESNGLMIDLSRERIGNAEWSTVSQELLTDELHKMRDDRAIVILREAGAIFEVIPPPATVQDSDVSEFEKARW